MRLGFGLGLTAVRRAPSAPPVQLTVAIAASADDASEAFNGVVNLTGTSFNWNNAATLGLRFLVPTLPQGATIVDARISLQELDGVHDAWNGSEIVGENADAAAQYTTAANNITNRAATTASVTWDIPANTQVHTTPNLAAIVQEIVDRPGFDGVLAFMFSAAEAPLTPPLFATFDRPTLADPSLTVEYTA